MFSLKSKNLNVLKEYLTIFFVLSIYAWTVNQLLVSHTIITGALTGFCEILYFATNSYVPIWLSNLVVNVILLIVACICVGWKFCIRTIFGVMSLTFWLKIIPITNVPVISEPFMATIICGILNGIAIGTVFLNNGSSGGTDIIAMIVSELQRN